MEESPDHGAFVAKAHSPNIARISSFSDAVFAVAITLLVLSIDVPIVSPERVGTELPSKLLTMWHQYFAYALSFFIIGFFWILHHRVFRYVKRYNEIFIWINLLLLMLVVFVPFTTDLNSTYRDSKAAFAMFAGNVGLVSLVLGLLWLYAIKGRRLTGEELEPLEARRAIIESLITALLLFAGMGVACLDLGAGRIFVTLIFVADFLVDMLGGKRKFKIFE